ncbi:hypothetical protein GCM10022234_17190 [Aeromicrobium panaciterrae]|uniref:Ig-like domain-containing protein n=1 Tax=Aeromicrobium panaciterrae TaxID=363861 RepID=UPI0031E0086C
MRSVRVLIAAILMVALCSVGSTAVAQEADAAQDSTSTPTSEPTPDPEPAAETPAPPEDPTPSPEPTKDAPSPDPEPTADPTPKDDPAPKDDSRDVPPAPKASKKQAVALAADAFAVDDEYTMVENSVNTLLDPSVTTNDTGIKAGSGFVHSGASHGLVVNLSGGFAAAYTYAPFADFVGDDTFTYTFTGTDDLEHTATVTIHVTSDAGEPHAVDDEYTVVQDSGTTLLDPDVTANDIGIPGVTLYSNSPAGHGTVTNSNPLNGHVYSYTPDSGFHGDDTFTYAFLDAEGHPHNGAVTIHVTALPGEAVDDEYTVMQDSGTTVLNPDVAANDTGIGEFEVFSHGPAAHGFISNTGPFGGGHDWAYSTSLGFFGDDTFEYTFIGNDGLEHTATVTIHVLPTTVTGQAVDDEYTIEQDSGVYLLTPAITDNDTGIDYNTPFAHTSASHGFVSDGPASGNHDLMYASVPGYIGDDTFTYTFFGINGSPYTATVTIHVTPSPGEAVDDEFTVAQDSGPTELLPNVILNDRGVSSSSQFSNTPASHGTVTNAVPMLTTSYSYTPTAGYFGDDSFTYTFVGNDGLDHTATVTIHVLPTPGVTISPDANTITEDSAPNPVSGNVLTNDTSPVGTMSVTTAGTFTLGHGVLVIHPDGTYTYTLDNTNPDVDALNDSQTLTDTFTYGASNGQGSTGSAKLTITIHGHTDPVPSAVDDDYTVAQDSGATLLTPTVTANDSAAMPLTFTNTPATHGTVTSSIFSSDYSYTPTPGFSGDDTFTYSFLGTNFVLQTATVTIHVTPTAPLPAAVNDEYTVTQGSGATLLDPDVYANDTGAIPNTFSHSGAPHGTVSGGAAGGHDYSYQPFVGFHGDDTFTYTFLGSDLSMHTATVTVHVTPTVTPAAVDDEYTVAQDSGATLLNPDVAGNDAGALPGTFSHTAAGHGTVDSATLSGSDFSYEPNDGYFGDDSFTYVFVGTDLQLHAATVTIHVTPTPSAAVNDEYTVAQDSGTTQLMPDVTGNDSGFTAPFTHGSSSHGTVTSTLGGHDFGYEPDAGFFGDDTFTYTFTGTDNVSRTGTVTIHVIKTPLQAMDDSYTVTGDQPTVLNPPVTSNDLGLDPGVTTSLATQPAHGTAAIDSSGNITFTPKDGYVGSDSFTYQLDVQQVPRVLASAAAVQDLTGTVTLTVADPDNAVGGTGGSGDDTTESARPLPDTGTGLGSSDLALALLLVLLGTGIVVICRRGPRQV